MISYYSLLRINLILLLQLLLFQQFSQATDYDPLQPSNSTWKGLDYASASVDKVSVPKSRDKDEEPFRPFVFPDARSKSNNSVTPPSIYNNASSNSKLWRLYKRGIKDRISVGHPKLSENIGEIHLKNNEANGVYLTTYSDPLHSHHDQQGGPAFYADQYKQHQLQPHHQSDLTGPIYESHHHSAYGYDDTPIPFDSYGGSYHRGHGEGAYHSQPYPHSPYDSSAVHKPSTDFSYKRLLAKSFLIPLASAAVLGIAAALVSNPLLLQLGTVSNVAPALAGKRKRRSIRATYRSSPIT